MIQRINKTISWFSETINMTDIPLAKGPRDNVQINKIGNKKGDITTEPEEIQKIIRSYCKCLYSTKLEKLSEMEDFLDKYLMSKLNQERKPSKQAHIP